MKRVRPVALVILDGFGHSDTTKNNAISQAFTPHLSQWLLRYPHTYIRASGVAVGLPLGAVGNSEVGHVTIGAGRIVPQPARIIHEAICDGSFFKNDRLQHALLSVIQNRGRLHTMGLLSDAGVHSTLELIQASIQAAVDAGVGEIFVHAFLDGRDVIPQSAATYLELLDATLKMYKNVTLGSLHGRFYAMDRDHNWDRIEKSYRALTEPISLAFSDWKLTLAHYYAQHITDEFISPTQLHSDAIICDGDGIFFTNYRPDRARELTDCFVLQNVVPFTTKVLNLSCFITPVSYGVHEKTTALFDRPVVINTLKAVLSAYHKTIFSIAETEKYAHVTYFFNGEVEDQFPSETRVLVPSIHTKNYVGYPCMSAAEITHKVVESLQENPADFYLINYANADMVGHSGNFNATVKAIECLDEQLGRLYEQVVNQMDGILIITADHGKAEQMVDTKTEQPRTGHTANLVPFIIISQDSKLGTLTLPTQLSEIAPFILQGMNITIPYEMRK